MFPAVSEPTQGCQYERTDPELPPIGTEQEGPPRYRLFLNQLHLLGLGGRDAHALYPTVGGVEDFELQAFVFDDFAFLGNAFGEFAYQAGYASVFAYILSAV